MSFRHLPVYYISGWEIEKRQKTLTERFPYVVKAYDGVGNQIEEHGFNSKHDAVTFCHTHKPTLEATS